MKKLLVILMVLAGGAAMADRKAVHGMLLFGKEKTYLSHLPMFHSPHDYQVIFEVDLGKVASEHYDRYRKDHPDEVLFTVAPDAFELPEMIANPKPFYATLYQGHFERGGKRITRLVQLNITKVIYSKKLDPNAEKPATPLFMLVGTPAESFLVHLITARPDYDQVIDISKSPYEQIYLEEDELK